MKKITALIIVLSILWVNNTSAQNSTPEVSNVTFSQRSDGTMLIDVNYDVHDADGDTMIVTMEVSDDAGGTWNLSCEDVTGDIGDGIISGEGKQIVWDFGNEHPDYESDQIVIKIIADDGVEDIYGIPCPGDSTVTYEGKTYNTVQIGDQCWLKENLDVGEMIQGSENAADNNLVEKYCYNNDPANCETYGGLYQWNEAMQYSTTEGAQGICPEGWYIPTKAEFETLKASVNNDGNALKAVGQGDGVGTNTSGFSALLAGLNKYFSEFLFLGDNVSFWSSTEYDAAKAHDLSLYRSSTIDMSNYGIGKLYGFSVRCLKGEDAAPNNSPDTPANPDPMTDRTDVAISGILSWSCNDPDGDPLTYDVYMGTDTVLVSSDQSETTYNYSNLGHETTYYWKIVAKDDYGNSTEGPVWTFTTESDTTTYGIPCPDDPTVTYAGKTYNTVQIGDQCWLKENLDVGTMIQGSEDPTDNSTIEKYCYDNDASNCETYGGLYQWDEAMQYTTTEGTQGICPYGWHVPTTTELRTLRDAVGNSSNALKAVGEGTGSGAETQAASLRYSRAAVTTILETSAV